jgi:hypothetical protein
LLDDLGFDYAAAAEQFNASNMLAQGMSANTMQANSPFTDTFDKTQLWLELTNVAGGMVNLNLHNATNQVYAIWVATNLSTGWSVETEVWPTNSDVMPFSVASLNRQTLFLRAQDWTGFTENGNTVPDWWFWNFFHSTVLSDTDLDSQGNTLLYDYTNAIDPNPIRFSIRVTNQFVNTSQPTLQLVVASGVPENYALLVDSTNFLEATWTAYGSSNIILNLGSSEGWHEVRIGLKDSLTNSAPVWAGTRVKLDLTAPALIITNPTAATVMQPMIQLQGYSPEALAHISYDLQNAAQHITNRDVFVLNRHYSTNTWEFTTNAFQAFDVPLTNGANTLTLHATDLAGNSTTASYTFTLDYSDKPPPTIDLFWPQDGAALSGSSFTWRGHVDDFTAKVQAQVTDASEKTTVVNALVERDGHFWAQNLPLSDGENYLTMTATDAAGNVSTKSITVLKSAVSLTFNEVSPDQLWNPNVTASGTIDSSDYAVWVNGVRASMVNGTWQAQNVPMTPGGTAVFQVRAIPNTDHEGNGTGGSGGTSATYESSGNPASSSAIDIETEPEKQMRIYLEAHAQTWDDSMTVDEQSVDYTDVTTHADYSWKCVTGWKDKGGGSGNETETWQVLINAPPLYDNCLSTQTTVYDYSWPPSPWPNLAWGPTAYTENITSECGANQGVSGTGDCGRLCDPRGQ